MTLPNFLIVGGAKCGTTSLFHYIKQHPEIGMIKEKSTSYFTWHRKRVETLEEYAALFDGIRGKKAIGEAPTKCLYDPVSAGMMKRDLPDAKIIIILRNPADMAHSLWGHMVRNGEKLSFVRALKEEPRRMADPSFKDRSNNWHGDYYYFNMALYYNQVKRYIDAFGREKVQVLLFDDFKKDPVKTCQEIFRFLEVAPGFVPVIERHNTGKVYRHRGLHKLLTKPPSWLKRVMSAGVRETLVKLNTKPVPSLDRALRRELLEKYRPDIEKLEGLIGRDLSDWLRDA